MAHLKKFFKVSLMYKLSLNLLPILKDLKYFSKLIRNIGSSKRFYNII
jgi:hypothetical protein